MEDTERELSFKDSEIETPNVCNKGRLKLLSPMV